MDTSFIRQHTQEGKLVTYLILRVGVQVASVTLLTTGSYEQLNPLKFLDAFLFLRRSPSSSLLLKLEEE
jgi:hypothetical protein